MNSRQYVLTFIILIMLPLMLFHFQNCAPVSSSQASMGSLTGDVHLIEDLNKVQIQFVSPDAEVQDDAPTADVGGLCNRTYNGGRLTWKVFPGQDNTGQAVTSGNSVCDHGEFSVSLVQLDQFVCGVDHLLVVEADWGGSTFSHFSRRCQPLANQPVAVPAGSPAGTTCSLEYSPASAADQPCVQVCYRDNLVVYSHSEDVTQCSVLAEGLAGQ